MENDTSELLSKLEVRNADTIYASYIKQSNLSDDIKMELDIIVGAIILQYTAVGMSKIAAKENPDTDENELFLEICNIYADGLEKEAARLTRSRFTVVDGNKKEED